MADTTSEGPSFRLVYRSRLRIPSEQRRAELGEIFSEARSKNPRREVSGALLVGKDWVVQVLEGDEDTVRSLYDRIRVDTRHERVHLLTEQEVPTRVFGRWSMARVSDEGEEDIPLLMNRDKGGISPAAPRRSTPEQEELLASLREALREEESQRA